MKTKRRMSIRFKILIPTAVVIILFGIIMGVSSYLTIYDGMVSMGFEEAGIVAKAVAETIDGDELRKIVPGSENTPEYQELLVHMRSEQEIFGIKFLYTLYTDEKCVYYGIDSDTSSGQQKVGEEFEVPYEELKEVFMGSSYKDKEIDYTEDGVLISEYYPIYDKEGNIAGILGCDYDAEDIVGRLTGIIIKTIIISLVCMGVALLLVGVIVQNIMYSLKLVDKKVYDLVEGDGDLGKKLEVNTGDELEDIAEHVNMVLGHIYDQANVAKEVAEGNLTVTVVPKSENDLLGNAIKQMVEQNSSVLSGIRDAAKQAKTGSSQMADACEALAQGSTEQAAAIEEITASMGTVTEQTTQNAQNAKEAARLILQAIETVKEGNQHMLDLMEAMKEISTAAEGISKINKSINDIAFQTNILALNAAVEASRAGAAGKGFSVVAEEVRTLAGKSAEAAAEANTLIENSVRKTEVGEEIAGEMKGALEAITEVVGRSVDMIEGIAASSEEQTTAIGQINTSVEQVSRAIQSNSSASQECADTSAEVSRKMGAVDKMLEVYKLK